MLPNTLLSTYKQYKADTDTIATWIAGTAKKCGYSNLASSRPTAISAQQTSKRLKGKERKQAKEAGGGKLLLSPSAADKKESSKPAYPLSIKEFTTLAEYIADFEPPPVVVPANFFEIIDRAIDARTKHNKQMYEHNKSRVKAESHGYFVGVLRKVRDTLMRRKGKKAPESTPDDIDGLLAQCTNQFEALKVEQSAEQHPDAGGEVPPPPITEPSEDKYTIDVSEDLEELFFAIQFFMNDVINIRNDLNGNWDFYRYDIPDPVPAALQTNAAIDMVRRLEQDLKADFPRLKSYEDIGQAFFLASCQGQGYEIPKANISQDYFFEHYELAEEAMVFCASNLHAYFRQVRPGAFPITHESRLPGYDLSDDRTKMSTNQKIDEDAAIMVECLQDLLVFVAASKNGQKSKGDDEILEAVRVLSKQEYPVWAVFAIQSFVDAIHVLREDVEKPFQSLQSYAQTARTSLEQAMKLPVGGFESNFRYIFMLIKEWTEIDRIQTSYHSEFRQASGTVLKFRLLKRYPVRCAILTALLKSHVRTLGVQVANTVFTITSACHLYNTLRQENLIKHRWDDITLMLGFYNKSSFFVDGTLPRSPEDYIKNFGQAGGMGLASFTPQQKGKKSAPPGPAKKMKDEISPVTDVFLQSLNDPNQEVKYTPDKISQIIEQQNFRFEVTEDPTVVAAEQSSNPKLRAARERWMRTGSIHPVKLLHFLGKSLYHETIRLAVSPLDIHKSICVMYKEFRPLCGPGYTKFLGPAAMIVGEGDMPFMTSYLLGMAAQRQSGVLEKVGKALDEILEKNRGKTQIKAMAGAGILVNLEKGWILAKGAGAKGFKVVGKFRT
ncbi:hypothetical protein ABW19_dt0204170 [Dactylella cylindrospora]|nr:hypothetical protein ABW19_dt0204170 [Dactylella cylindrospora]